MENESTGRTATSPEPVRPVGERFGAGSVRTTPAGRPAEDGSRDANPDIGDHVSIKEEERRGARTGDRDGLSQAATGGENPSPALRVRLTQVTHLGKSKVL